jgi:gas vesicle protein
MADNDYDNGVGGFGWFLAGLGIGALVGVLYAPKSGRETRDELVAGAMDARDKAQQMYGQSAEAVGQYVEKGKEVAGQYVDKGKEFVDKGRTQWSEYVEKGKGMVQGQTDKVASAIDAGKEAYAKTATGESPSMPS